MTIVKHHPKVHKRICELAFLPLYLRDRLAVSRTSWTAPP
jgi:hypothetical protein